MNENGIKAIPYKFQFMILPPNAVDEIEFELDEIPPSKLKSLVTHLPLMPHIYIGLAGHAKQMSLKIACRLNNQ